jgi:GNAT superfamily N-acetyltransferase
MSSFTFLPVTTQNWEDFETVMGPNGASWGCWCMYLRQSKKEFDAKHGEPNRLEMKAVVDGGEVPGILAYVDEQPAGWCSVAPRDAFPRLERSRVAKRIDDQPVWSVICFFVRKKFRQMGVSTELLKAAVAYARDNGARIIEGYPVDPKKDTVPDAFIWQGLADAFRQAGFKEVARRTETRPYMRLVLED